MFIDVDQGPPSRRRGPFGARAGSLDGLSLPAGPAKLGSRRMEYAIQRVPPDMVRLECFGGMRMSLC
jgi:hypothetical protein